MINFQEFKPQISNGIVTPNGTRVGGSNDASEFYKHIAKMIYEFEQKLDPQQEVGARLVSFGQSIQFHIDGIGYQNPSLIRFIGTLDNGSKVELIKHVNQISFLLMSLPKLNKNETARRIGFIE